MAMIEAAGVAVDVDADPPSAGAPAILLIHDIASGAPALEAVAHQLRASGARTIRYDRRGYGASGTPEPYTATTIAEQALDALAILDHYEARGAVLAGDGLGALVALELAILEPWAVGAVVARDPPAFAFVPAATEELSAQREVLQDALARGGPQAGIAAWLGERASTRDGQRALNDVRGFYADYAGLTSFGATRPQLRALTIPVVLVTGPHTPPAVREAVAALGDLIPRASTRDDGDLAGGAAAIARA